MPYDDSVDVEDLQLLGHAKCRCGAPISEPDYYNAGLCIPCWNYDASINHLSNIRRV